MPSGNDLTPNERWLCYKHTGEVGDLIHFLEAGTPINEEMRAEIISKLNRIKTGKRNPYLKKSIVEAIKWEMTETRRLHMQHGTREKSYAALFQEIAVEYGMTSDAVKKIWGRREISEERGGASEPDGCPF